VRAQGVKRELTTGHAPLVGASNRTSPGLAVRTYAATGGRRAGLFNSLLGSALVAGPAVLWLDEPSSGLDRRETATLADVLAGYTRTSRRPSCSSSTISRWFRQLSDRLYVIDAGHMIATGPTADVLAEPAVRSAYQGRLSAGGLAR